MSTADTGNVLEKNLDSAKARHTYCEHFSTKLVQQWIKMGWKLRLQ
jgi:hypothetical protein